MTDFSAIVHDPIEWAAFASHERVVFDWPALVHDPHEWRAFASEERFALDWAAIVHDPYDLYVLGSEVRVSSDWPAIVADPIDELVLVSASLSSEGPLPPPPPVAPAISDWCEKGKSWLLAQFRHKPKIEALLCVFLDEVQALERAWAELLELRSLERAEGVQLDDVGVLLGLSRPPGIDDVDYRRALRGKALANHSGGRPDEMITILTRMLAGSHPFAMRESYPLSVRFFVSGVLQAPLGRLFARVLGTARPTTVNHALVYEPADLVVTFDDDTLRTLQGWGEEGGAGAYHAPLAEEDSGAVA